jgi:hypothetical protein
VGDSSPVTLLEIYMVLSLAVTVIVNSIYTEDVYPHFYVLCSVYVVAVFVKDYFCTIIMNLSGLEVPISEAKKILILF